MGKWVEFQDKRNQDTQTVSRCIPNACVYFCGALLQKLGYVRTVTNQLSMEKWAELPVS